MEGKYYERVAVAVIFAVILGALLRQCWIPSPKKRSTVRIGEENGRPRNVSSPMPVGNPNDPETVYRYILHVIRYGSHQFDFPGGVMEGGYLSSEEAPKVACYVMELGGRRCPHPAAEDAAMFFTSVCGGCHGNDGKGLHGAYPDLTRSPLLGIEKMIKAGKR